MPAISVGRALVRRGHPAETIRFVGSSRGIESRLVPEAGFEVDLLPGRGIARRMTVDNVGALIGLADAVGRAVRLLGHLRPAVVVSVGGYASAPCVVAAAGLRLPLVVAEQNAVPGLTNRVAARLAKASAVSFPGTPLPRAVLTGNPIRPEVAAVDRSETGRAAARAELGLPPDALVVVAAGGSLGARSINEAVVGLADLWADRPGACLLHLVGERDFAELSRRAPTPQPGGLVYVQRAFEPRMDLVLSAADVMVERAGASAVAELAVAGVASVLVPLPGAPGDHQTMNARRLAEVGAAVVVADADLSPSLLAETLEPILADTHRREAMGDSARLLARPDAADAVAGLAERYARA
jgi:undecaprenyldiphospho-muramoylpentapeptide beta-N-acetylglucosaminyltransferase